MLKHLRSLEAKFLLWIAAGFAILFAGPLWFRASWCPSPPSDGMNHEKNGGPIDNGEHPESYQYGTTYIVDSISNAFAIIVQTHQAKSDKEREHAPGEDVVGTLSNLLCDARITDISLVYFTYCLVIVGWFTMRSGERTYKDIERAIIFGGAITAIPDRDEKGNIILVPQWANYGRSSALLREIRIGTSDDEPMSSTADYSQLKSRRYDLVVHPVVVHPNARNI